MAFLFGSYAKERETLDSDLDVAVYFKPPGKEVEWEEAKEYTEEDTLWEAIEKKAGVNTDLIVLNRAPSTLASTIIQEGIPIIIKNHSLYWRYYLIVSSEATAFRDFMEDFWRIKQRSGSLSEIDRERLLRIVDFLEEELKEYPNFKNITQETFERESAKRRNLERWVENIVNASIDIAKILLASEKKRIPQTYHDVLKNLSLLKGFHTRTADNLARFVKLRNILAHEYLDLRFKRIKYFIQESEHDYKTLLSFVKTLLSL